MRVFLFEARNKVCNNDADNKTFLPFVPRKTIQKICFSGQTWMYFQVSLQRAGLVIPWLTTVTMPARRALLTIFRRWWSKFTHWLCSPSTSPTFWPLAQIRPRKWRFRALTPPPTSRLTTTSSLAGVTESPCLWTTRLLTGHPLNSILLPFCLLSRITEGSVFSKQTIIF